MRPFDGGGTPVDSSAVAGDDGSSGTEDGPPSVVRASDAERGDVADRLRAAAADGRLTLEEFSERVGRAYAATGRADLLALTADLPAAAEGAAEEPRVSRGTRWIVGIMGGGDHRGRWRVAARCTVLNLMGGADLDLRQALVDGSETEITVVSVMGGSDIIVPDGVEVVLQGFAVMGANDLHVEGPPPPPGAPVVHVRAFSLMGGTVVKTARPGAARPRRTRHRLH